MDLMVLHNRSAADSEKLTLENIIHNCLIFQLAAIDTSRNTTEFMLQHLARDQECQHRFSEEIVLPLLKSDLRDYGTYERSEQLQSFTKEVLRMYSSATMLLNRYAIKDFKLGNFKIARGTRFNVFIDTIHHS